MPGQQHCGHRAAQRKVDFRRNKEIAQWKKKDVQNSVGQ